MKNNFFHKATCFNMLTNMLTEMNKESSNARCRKRDKLGADWFFEGKLTS